MMISIIKMVLLPLLAGVGFNYFFPRQVAKVTKIMPMLSALVIIFTVGCVVSLSGRTILDNGSSSWPSSSSTTWAAWPWASSAPGNSA